MDKKRDIWTHEEMMCLLKIMTEKDTLKLLDTKKYRSADLFKVIEKEMNNFGYHRNHFQIRIKYKNWKYTYAAAKKQLDKNGVVTSNICPYYKELDELFKNCPPSRKSKIDSTEINNYESQTFTEELSDLSLQNSLSSFKCESNESLQADVKMFDNIPDSDEAMPGSSTDSDPLQTVEMPETTSTRTSSLCSKCNQRYSPYSAKRNGETDDSLEKIVKFVIDAQKEMVTNVLQQQAAENARVLNTQMEMMREITNAFLNTMTSLSRSMRPPSTSPSQHIPK